MANTHPIGKSFPRKEGRKKVTGQALYIDDLSFPEMLHGATVRSPAARGRIIDDEIRDRKAELESTLVDCRMNPDASMQILHAHHMIVTKARERAALEYQYVHLRSLRVHFIERGAWRFRRRRR